MILWCAGVYQQSPTFRSVTLQPVGVDKATIWQIKENFLSFDMMYVRSICPNRLHGKIKWRPLPFFPLVCDVRTLIYIMAAEITLSAHLQMNISGKLDTIDFDNIEEVEVRCLE